MVFNMNAAKTVFGGKTPSVTACLLSLLLTACGGGSGGGAVDPTDNQGSNPLDSAFLPAEDCSVAGINRWIDESMRDEYIYYDSVPVVNLDDYTDPAELVRDLRVAPDVYSSIVDQQLDEQLINNSTVPPKFGFFLRTSEDGKRRFADISGNSPMEIAGVQRGDHLVAINGVVYEDLTNEQWREFIVGEPEELVTAVFTVFSSDGLQRDIEVTKKAYVEKTVSVYGNLNDQTGYLKLDAFRGTSSEELDTAVASFVSNGTTELILDLRYNGGGYTRVARKLASQIAGEAFVGQVYSRREFNDKYSQYNIEQKIESQTLNLGLSRLLVLTTSATASASETLINGLSPLIDTVVIGTKTEGKPFTSLGRDYCGKRLNAMSTLTTNGVGVSVAGGIEPTCTVNDQYIAPADSDEDALTGAALEYIQSGRCPQGSVSPLATASTADSL